MEEEEREDWEGPFLGERGDRCSSRVRLYASAVREDRYDERGSARGDGGPSGEGAPPESSGRRLLPDERDILGCSTSASSPLNELPFPSEYIDDEDEALVDRVPIDGREGRGREGEVGAAAEEEERVVEEVLEREEDERVRN